MKKLKSLEYDLGYVQAAVGLLESYLISDAVFWPLGENPPAGEPDYPSLTLDGVLLAKERMLAHPMSTKQQAQVEGVVSNLDEIRTRRRVAWERKASQCYQVRLHMWGNYLQEYQDNPADQADRYTYEVRLRAMLGLSGSEMTTPDKAEIQLLDRLDGYLKSVLVPAGFIWEAEVQAGFSPDRYWYLYGNLPSFPHKR